LDLLGHLPPETAQESEIDILERISDVLYAQGEMQQSVEIDGRVADLAAQRGFKAAQVNALTRQARALAFLAPDRCVTVCERAVEISRTLDDPLLQARAEMLMACWHVIANGGDANDAPICAAAREKIQSLSDQLPAYYEILYAHVQFTQSDFLGAYQTANAGLPKSIENDNLVVYFSAHSSLAQALLHLGRWGELLSVIRRALEAADKNGNAPWAGIFRATLAWTQCLACDHRGARTEAERLLQSYTDEPAGQIRTMALIAAGFASLGMKECDRALDYFRTVCQRPADPRFFLDWYWQRIGEFGLARTLVARGEIAEAAERAEQLWQLAQHTSDVAFRALTWELHAQIAIAKREWACGLEHLERAFAAKGVPQIPMVAWRLHVTAAELHMALEDHHKAENHRAAAAAILMRLAHSLPEGELLREALLAVPSWFERGAEPLSAHHAAYMK